MCGGQIPVKASQLEYYTVIDITTFLGIHTT